MTYRFKVNEPVAGGASRIGLEQIEIAETRLASREDIPTAIHDARRCLKRLRALLRLVRPALPDSTYRREATRIAGVGRLLADARDRHVMRQTLIKLETGAGALPKAIGTKLGKLLLNGGDAGAARSSGTAGRRQALRDLAQARSFFARLDRRKVGLPHLAAGLERSYRRARRAFREAYDSPSDEAFHEWRKTVQQHWRHMQLLSRGWPEVLIGRAGEAKEVSRLLGEDHDLHVLQVFASERGKAVLSEAEVATVVAACGRVQSDLRQRAEPRGQRLFAEPANDLSDRIMLYWSAARDLSAVSQASGGKDEKPAKPQRRLTRRRRPAAAGPAAQAAARGSPGPGSGRPGR